ncbi:MAG: CSLREA domain-containing protein [Actinobacteria bacterium]|nr:CSLREA domain-containing protein [Actinomycetota bacterium]
MTNGIRRSALCLFACAMLFPTAAGAASFQVTTTADSTTGSCAPGSCTLRQAVGAANTTGGINAILVPAGTYSLVNGELTLSRRVSIHGAGAGATRLVGNGLSRVLNVKGGVVAEVDGLSVEGGGVTGTSAAQAHGGGILNAGRLTLNGVVVSGNRVAPADNTGTIPEGGGIFNSGTLAIAGSTISGNEATTFPFGSGIPSGGGIANSNGEVTITNSAITGNTTLAEALPQGAGLNSTGSAPHEATVTLLRSRVEGNRAVDPSAGGVPYGGGIWAFRTDLTVEETAITGNTAKGGAVGEGAGIEFLREGDLVIERSLVAGNLAEGGVFANGGGLAVNGETTEEELIVNSTIAGNRATAPFGGSGGGIYHFGGTVLEVLSSTIAANTGSGNPSGSRGGNIYEGSGGSATLLRDSIVSGGAGSPGLENCFGANIKSAGHNIDGLDQCNFHAAGDRVNTNPLLGPLADNGGPTATMALSPSSPAIDAGDASCPPTDQRGVPRPQGAGCDIGAFELVPAKPPAPTPPPPPKGAELHLARKAKVDLRSGKGRLGASCPNAAAGHCKAALVLSSKGRRGKGGEKLGSVSGTIRGGRKGKLSVALSPRGLAALAAAPGHRLTVTLAGKSTNDAGEVVRIRATVLLQGKAHR